MPKAEPRHILSLSGGKDSAALAIHMRGRIPGMGEHPDRAAVKRPPELIGELAAYLLRADEVQHRVSSNDQQ